MSESKIYQANAADAKFLLSDGSRGSRWPRVYRYVFKMTGDELTFIRVF